MGLVCSLQQTLLAVVPGPEARLLIVLLLASSADVRPPNFSGAPRAQSKAVFRGTLGLGVSRDFVLVNV